MNKFITYRRKILIAVSIWIVTAVLAWIYLKRAEDRLNARYKTNTVLVSKKYIPAGKEITMDMVETKNVPIAFLEPTALSNVEELKILKGKASFKARIGLLKGEQMTRSKLVETGGSLNLAWTIPPDQVALSLRLSPDQSVAGLVRPGDWVSVYGVFDMQPGLSEPECVPILARSQVIGVQNNLWDPANNSSEKIEWKELSNDFILVTLSVTPEQANRLMLASVKSHLALGLHSALNAAAFRTGKIKLSQIVRS